MIVLKSIAVAPVFEADKEKPLSFIFSYLGKKCKGSLKQSLHSLHLDRYHYVLSIICRKQKVTQQSLVKCLGIDKATVVRIIDHLSEHNLVKRSINPNDRREHIIIPTAKALKMLPRIESAFIDTHNIALKGFTKKEITNFKGMLKRIEFNLSEMPLDENK